MIIDIVAVKYHEEYYNKQLQSIENVRGYHKLILVDRDIPGIGSLSKAIDEGIAQSDADAILVVTNITVQPDIIEKLSASLNLFDAIQPTYESDHVHLRKGEGIKEVPFTEFTCVLVKRSAYEQVHVNKEMPYVGFDADWGYRMRKQGFKLAVDFNVRIDHTYMRFTKNRESVTIKRLSYRQRAENSTRQRLRNLYGINYMRKLLEL